MNSKLCISVYLFCESRKWIILKLHVRNRKRTHARTHACTHAKTSFLLLVSELGYITHCVSSYVDYSNFSLCLFSYQILKTNQKVLMDEGCHSGFLSVSIFPDWAAVGNWVGLSVWCSYIFTFFLFFYYFTFCYFEIIIILFLPSLPPFRHLCMLFQIHGLFYHFDWCLLHVHMYMHS